MNYLTEFKGPADGAAMMATILAVFQMIPWSEVAAAASAVWFLLRIYYMIKNQGKE